MDDETKAQRLAEWLNAPAGTEPPEDLDPEVLGAVYALVPDRAPAPRVSLDDILGGITAGPFAANGGEASVPPTTGTVVEFPAIRAPAPKDAPLPPELLETERMPERAPAREPEAGVPEPGAREGVKLVAHAGGRGREAAEGTAPPASSERTAAGAKRRGPSRMWMMPSIGLALAAAAATLVILPRMGLLQAPELGNQEAAREAQVVAPAAAPTTPPPVIAELEPTAADEGAPPPLAGADGLAPEQPAEPSRAQAGDAARTRDADTGALGNKGAPASEPTGLASGGEGAKLDAEKSEKKETLAELDAIGEPIPAKSGEASRRAAAGNATPMTSSATTSSAPTPAPVETPPPPPPSAAPTAGAPAGYASGSTQGYGSGPSASQAPVAPASGAVAQDRAATEKRERQAAKPSVASSSAPARREDRTYIPEAAAPNLEREAEDDSMKDADVFAEEESAAKEAVEAVVQSTRSASSGRQAKTKAAPASDASNVQTPSARASAHPLDHAGYAPPADVASAFAAAVADEGAGRWAEAADRWRALMADSRASVAQEAALRAAKALRAAGRPADAVAAVDSGLRRSSANTPVRSALYALRGDLLAAMGRAGEAEAAWAEAARLNATR